MNDANPKMSEANKCPQCGTPLKNPALGGLCPACLLAQGAAADTVTEARQPFIPPTVEELAPLFPQLEILELIGKGGMGAVYKAQQKELDRIVALKILPPGIGETAGFAERFTREAKALAKLNHPNIVTIHDFGVAAGVSPGGENVGSKEITKRSEVAASSSTQPGGRMPPSTSGQRPDATKIFYFIMEFVDGVTLRQLLQGSRISPHEALAIVPQICDALQFAHDHGIVHRDIKPDNILMDRRGRVKVADFGLAKLVGVGQTFLSAGSGDFQVASGENAGLGNPANRQAGKPALQPDALTDAGKVMGTPNYMAPEQKDRPLEVDHRADIYALGVVFYQMLTGELPGKPIERPSKRFQIDVRLDEIVLRALENDPNRRYEKASVLKTQIETMVGTPEPQFSHEVEKSKLGSFAKTNLSRSSIPWQIWVAVVMLGLEGLGNLLSIQREPIALLWLGAKALLITGLLLKWRPVFVLALLLAGIHVVYFASAKPLAAVINLVLLGLIGSTFRFYFPSPTPSHANEARETGPNKNSKPVRSAIAAIIIMFGIGVIAAATPFVMNRYLSGVVTDAATGKPLAGANVSIWSPDRSSGSIINRTPRAKADGRLRIFIPRKLITPDFKAIVDVHAAGYESGSWDFSEVQADSSKGQLNFQLHSTRQSSLQHDAAVSSATEQTVSPISKKAAATKPFAQGDSAWFLAGSNPKDYETSTDANLTHSGKPSAFLQSIAPNPKGFATLMQMFKADKFQGKRVRMTGYVRSENVMNSAALWMRVDGKNGEALAFDNMGDRPIKGTTDWTKYEIVLDVPASAHEIAFGILLSGRGQVWMDALNFEVIGNAIATSGKNLPEAPQLNFAR